MQTFLDVRGQLLDHVPPRLSPPVPSSAAHWHACFPRNLTFRRPPRSSPNTSEARPPAWAPAAGPTVARRQSSPARIKGAALLPLIHSLTLLMDFGSSGLEKEPAPGAQPLPSDSSALQTALVPLLPHCPFLTMAIWGKREQREQVERLPSESLPGLHLLPAATSWAETLACAALPSIHSEWAGLAGWLAAI